MSDEAPEIDIEQLDRALAEKSTVIDIREEHEYVAGHVPGVAWIPMAQLPGRLHELDRGKPVYLVCASGNRTSVMAELLNKAGFDAYSVAGGTGAWEQSGRRIERGEDR